jgi:hypothetical protein
VLKFRGKGKFNILELEGLMISFTEVRIEKKSDTN